MSDFGSSSMQKIRSQESSDSSQSTVAYSETSLSTLGQLMRSTAQAIQHLYRDRLGHTPSRVTCDLVHNKLLVWAEHSITRPEQVLRETNSSQLAATSATIKEGLRLPLTELIEHYLKVKVVTLLSDICYDQNCTAMVVLLSSPPRVRSSRTRY